MAEHFGNEKLAPETDEKIHETIREVADEMELEVDIEETPDMLSLKVKDKGGDEHKMGFMKMNEGGIPIEGTWRPLGEVVEARLRFPNDDVSEAVEKFEKLKELKKRA